MPETFLKIKLTPPSLGNLMRGRAANEADYYTEADLKSVSISVYRCDEIDAARAKLEEEKEAIRASLTLLQQNLGALANAVDSVNKRLDEIEKRLV
jgi:prefoldin subunit 5